MRWLSTTSLALALVAVAASGCAAATGAELTEVPDEEGTVGALSAEGAGVVAATAPRSSVPPPAPTAEPAVHGARDLLVSFVAALATDAPDRAASLSTGPAQAFVRSLVQSQACGAGIAGGEVVEPGVAAQLVGPQQFRLEVDAVLRLDNGLERRITAIVVERQRTSAWLIADLEIGGEPASAMFPTVDSGGLVERQVRLLPVDLCVGPNRIETSFRVLNESEYPFVPVEVYFRDPDGQRHEVRPGDGGVDLLGSVVSGDSQLPDPWSVRIDVPDAFRGGYLVVVALDVDETQREGVPTPIEREYEIGRMRFFTDYDPMASVMATLDEHQPDATEQGDGPDAEAPSGSGGPEASSEEDEQ